MMARIHELARKRSQFVIATHSPILVAYPNSGIYQIASSGGLERVSLQGTERYVERKALPQRPSRSTRENPRR
jgi:predicted ATPase